jgi:hypothetical protein
MKLTKVLMDGGSVINILYKGAFKKLNVEASKLCPSHSPLHGIVPGRWVMPLGTITLSVMFVDQVHYHKETLSFEVIDFEGLTTSSPSQAASNMHTSVRGWL